MSIGQFNLGPAILFVPADRPDRYQKAADRSDTVVVDMEDAVAPDAKVAARRTVLESELDPERTVVRVNSVGTPWFRDDVDALMQSRYDKIMVPKVEQRVDIDRLAPLSVIAVCETPLGVVNATSIAQASNLLGMIAGVEDLVVAIGGSSTQWADTTYRDIARTARSNILLAATAYGKAAIDTVYLDIQDLAGQRREAEDAAASGSRRARASTRPKSGRFAVRTCPLKTSKRGRGRFSRRPNTTRACSNWTGAWSSHRSSDAPRA